MRAYTISLRGGHAGSPFGRGRHAGHQAPGSRSLRFVAPPESAGNSSEATPLLGKPNGRSISKSDEKSGTWMLIVTQPPKLGVAGSLPGRGATRHAEPRSGDGNPAWVTTDSRVRSGHMVYRLFCRCPSSRTSPPRFMGLASGDSPAIRNQDGTPWRGSRIRPIPRQPVARLSLRPRESGPGLRPAYCRRPGVPRNRAC